MTDGKDQEREGDEEDRTPTTTDIRLPTTVVLPLMNDISKYRIRLSNGRRQKQIKSSKID